VSGYSDIVRKLIVGGADVHIRDRKPGRETTALFEAATGGYAEVLRILIGAGADINADKHMGLNVSGWGRKEQDQIVWELVSLRTGIKLKAAFV